MRYRRSRSVPPRKMLVMPRVSVVVVNFRTPRLTKAAVSTSLDAGAAEVVVVDNASIDNIARVLPEDSRVRFLTTDRNRGFGTAANLGASHATGEVLVFLNSDAELTGSALEGLLAELERWEGRAIIGPRVVAPDGAVQRSAGLLPHPTDLILRALGLHRIGRWLASAPGIGSIVRRSKMAGEYDSSLSATSAVETSMISGACFAIGRAAFTELDGFDERFFMYFEDADLCRRAHAAGMPVRYLPEAVVRHVGGASSEGDYRFSPMHARSMRQYMEKWWGPRGAALALLLLWVRMIGHAITFRPGTRRAYDALRAAFG